MALYSDVFRYMFKAEQWQKYLDFFFFNSCSPPPFSADQPCYSVLNVRANVRLVISCTDFDIGPDNSLSVVETADNQELVAYRNEDLGGKTVRDVLPVKVGAQLVSQPMSVSLGGTHSLSVATLIVVVSHGRGSALGLL